MRGLDTRLVRPGRTKDDTVTLHPTFDFREDLAGCDVVRRWPVCPMVGNGSKAEPWRPIVTGERPDLWMDDDGNVVPAPIPPIAQERDDAKD